VTPDATNPAAATGSGKCSWLGGENSLENKPNLSRGQEQKPAVSKVASIIAEREVALQGGRQCKTITAALDRIYNYAQSAHGLALMQGTQGVLHCVNCLCELTETLGDAILSIKRGRQRAGSAAHEIWAEAVQ
jgi:hypothetical protein